ncbi:MAG TPA: cache domain-containing protein [Bryobacteraceae bacterium]|nr:cache domain-containing protein [Bryobacteraceae bacterium]
MLDRLEVKVSITKLLLALVVVIVPLSIFGLYLTGRSDKALDNNMGAQFRTISELHGGQVAEFIRDREMEANAMAADPAVVEAVVAADKAYGTEDEAATNAKVDKVRQEWNAPAGDVLVEKMLGSPASTELKHWRSLDPRLISIVIADEHGAVVAATTKPGNYSYTTNASWQSTHGKAEGTVNVGDILFDDVHKDYYADFGAPIFDQASSRFIGVMVAAVNVTDMLSRFQQAQVAGGPRALLVSGDGTVISGPKVDLFAHLKSDEFAAVRDSQGTLQGRQTGYVVADTGNGPRVIGYSNTGLKGDLGSMVLVSQSERDALGPLRGLEQFAVLMVILGILMLTLLFVYYFLHRTERMADIEEAMPAANAAAASH